MKFFSILTETLKIVLGTILSLIGLITGVIFYLESFQLTYRVLEYKEDYLSLLFWLQPNAQTNVPIFLGLCSIAGAILLASVKLQNIINYSKHR